MASAAATQNIIPNYDGGDDDVDDDVNEDINDDDNAASMISHDNALQLLRNSTGIEPSFYGLSASDFWEGVC